MMTKAGTYSYFAGQENLGTNEIRFQGRTILG